MLLIGSVAFGAVTLRDFSLALMVGLLVGAYSSIFIAAPVLVALKEREPRNRALHQRLDRADAGPAPSTTASTTADRSSAPDATSGVIAARPRKAKRKRHR